MPFLLFGGCSDGDNNTPEPSNKAQIFKEQRQALDQAKQVEQLIQNKDVERRLAIEEQSQ
jgi:hypothetical protein